MTYEELEARISTWAASQPAIRAIIVIGSRARGNPDRWSDLDLLVFSTDQALYADDPSWTSSFGRTLLNYMEPTSAGDPEWYVLFEGGLKIDAVIMPVADDSVDLETMVQAFEHWDAFRRGAIVLYDRDGSPRQFAPKPPKAHPLPTTAEFANVVSGVRLAAATTAKFVARGDYWRAQHWFSHDLRVHLLKLIEWQAQAAAPGRDTWYSGRFLAEWADPRAVAALPGVFPQFERASLEAALLAVLDLTGWLSAETADGFGFAYSTETHDEIIALVKKILSE